MCQNIAWRSRIPARCSMPALSAHPGLAHPADAVEALDQMHLDPGRVEQGDDRVIGESALRDRAVLVLSNNDGCAVASTSRG